MPDHDSVSLGFSETVFITATCFLNLSRLSDINLTAVAATFSDVQAHALN